jgi:hypothetical protein
METVRLILKILKLCTGVSTLCDFIFAYGHGYPQFGCLTEVLLGCITLKPPTVWQLRKYRLRRRRRLLLSSRQAQEHNKDRLFLSQNRRGCSEKVKRSSNTENIFNNFGNVFSLEKEI